MNLDHFWYFWKFPFVAWVSGETDFNDSGFQLWTEQMLRMWNFAQILLNFFWNSFFLGISPSCNQFFFLSWVQRIFNDPGSPLRTERKGRMRILVRFFSIIFSHSQQKKLQFVDSFFVYLVPMGWLRLEAPDNDRSLLQNIVSFIRLFCKRDLSF